MSRMVLVGNVSGKTAILVDDMVSNPSIVTPDQIVSGMYLMLSMLLRDRRTRAELWHSLPTT